MAADLRVRPAGRGVWSPSPGCASWRTWASPRSARSAGSAWSWPPAGSRRWSTASARSATARPATVTAYRRRSAPCSSRRSSAYQLHLQRADAPLLDLRTLKHRTYAVSLLLMSAAFMAFLGSMILLPLYLQNIRGLSPLQTGLLVMPGGLAMGLLGPQVGKIYDRLGSRPLVIPGSIGMVVALRRPQPDRRRHAVLADPRHPRGPDGVPGRDLHARCSPWVSATCRRTLYSHGSSLLGTLQQVAGAFGTAVLVVVMQNRSRAPGRRRLEPGGGVRRRSAVGVHRRCRDRRRRGRAGRCCCPRGSRHLRAHPPGTDRPGASREQIPPTLTELVTGRRVAGRVPVQRTDQDDVQLAPRCASTRRTTSARVAGEGELLGVEEHRVDEQVGEDEQVVARPLAGAGDPGDVGG